MLALNQQRLEELNIFTTEMIVHLVTPGMTGVIFFTVNNINGVLTSHLIILLKK